MLARADRIAAALSLESGKSAADARGEVVYRAELMRYHAEWARRIEGDRITQSRNVGDGVYKGFEISADWQLADSMVLTANDTYLHRTLNDPLQADYRPTQTPRHNAFLRLDRQATPALTVSPSVQVSSSHLSESTIQPENPAAIAYTRMGGFALANLDFA